MLTRRFSMILVLVFLVSGLMACSKGTPSASPKSTATTEKKVTFPTKSSIEFVVANTPGGGQDTMLRTMAKILAEEKIVNVPINVVNKPGGGFMTGMAYLKGHEGDGHYLMGTAPTLLMTPVLTNAEISYRDFTPIGCFGIDPGILVTYAGSGFNSFKDVVDYDGVINIGGSGKGSTEHMISYLLQSKAGVEINYIPFASDAEVAGALLGKQVELIVTSPASVMDYFETNQFIPLALSSQERSSYLKSDIPTFKELGYDISLCVFRAVIAPGNIPDEAVQFYADALEKMAKSEAFKKQYLEPNMIEPIWMGPEEFGVYQAKMADEFEAVMRDLGLVK